MNMEPDVIYVNFTCVSVEISHAFDLNNASKILYHDLRPTKIVNQKCLNLFDFYFRL